MNESSLGKSVVLAAVVAACAFAAPAAAAPPVVVYHRELPPDVKITGTEFDVDSHSSRPRIWITSFDQFSAEYHSESIPVRGLVLTPDRREVRYEADGTSVTCAVRKRFLWGASYEPTGACPVTVRSERLTAEERPDATAAEWVVELSPRGTPETSGLQP